jgi:hypothetical protein
VSNVKVSNAYPSSTDTYIKWGVREQGGGEEAMGCWGKFHIKGLHQVYSSPNIILVIKSRIRWAGYVARMMENRNANRIIAGKCEGRGPLETPRHESNDNI